MSELDFKALYSLVRRDHKLKVNIAVTAAFGHIAMVRFIAASRKESFYFWRLSPPRSGVQSLPKRMRREWSFHWQINGLTGEVEGDSAVLRVYPPFVQDQLFPRHPRFAPNFQETYDRRCVRTGVFLAKIDLVKFTVPEFQTQLAFFLKDLQCREERARYVGVSSGFANHPQE